MEIDKIIAVNAEDKAKIIADFSAIIPFDEASQKRMAEQEIDLKKVAHEVYNGREKQLTESVMRDVEKFVMLSVIDNMWMDHLDSIDDLREGIGLRGYAQRDPLTEYKAEAFNMFENLMAAIDEEIVHRIFKVQVNVPQQQPKTVINLEPRTQNPITPAATRGKPGRNDPCWCGSGKKYKRCHYPN